MSHWIHEEEAILLNQLSIELIIIIFLSAFLRNFFLRQDQLLSSDVPPGAALLSSSRAGTWFVACMQIGLRALSVCHLSPGPSTANN